MGKRTGRKSKYAEFVERKGLVLVEGWARDGLTDDQIAHNIGISRATYYDWKNKHPDFLDALKRSKEVADYEVESALFKKAKMGDTTAQIFWLKNRRPEKWRDKADMTLTPSNGVLESLLELKRDD